MTDTIPLPFELPAVRRKKLTVDFAGGNQSSNAGLLLLRQAEKRTGVCWRLSEVMPDARDPSRIQHAMFELIASRTFAITCGYRDGNDFDRLRHDPLLKLSVGRPPETGAPLASQSTISRLENAPSRTQAARLTAALVDQFAAFVTPGAQEVFDIDDIFCAAYGGQQMAFWNAHQDERGFAPIHILSCRDRFAGDGDPEACENAQRYRSAHRNQACHEAHAQTLADNQNHLAW